MNAKQRRKSYRRLYRKGGRMHYTLKIKDDLFGIFEHLIPWNARIVFRHPEGWLLTITHKVEKISKAEYETYVAFGLPVIEKCSLFGPLRITLPIEMIDGTNQGWRRG